jgi:hypothetical protein
MVLQLFPEPHNCISIIARLGCVLYMIELRFRLDAALRELVQGGPRRVRARRP